MFLDFHRASKGALVTAPMYDALEIAEQIEV